MKGLLPKLFFLEKQIEESRRKAAPTILPVGGL